jgi:hypothetical protein
VGTVLVELPVRRTASGPALVIELGVDERVTFGRGAPGAEVGMRLDHPGVSRLAGEIHAAGTFWFLANWSRQATYLVENVEGCGEHLRLSPGWPAVPVPFEISTVSIPAGLETVTFRVYASAQPGRAAPTRPAIPGTATEPTFPLDRQAKYFLVLVALCEPRLRGRTLAALPTTSQVAERLRPLPGCADLTARAVDFHIDYLARRKLRLRTENGVGHQVPAPGAGWVEGFAARRMLLADFALRFGLVGEDDLARLPSRSRSSSDHHPA